LHWSSDGWATVNDTDALAPTPGLFYVDLGPLARPGAWVFTFYWIDLQQWQQVDYRVGVS
jgi:hypothetical protein